MCGVNFPAFLLLLSVSLALSQQQCTRHYDLQSNRVINISSANYPLALPSGSNCRFRLKAPRNHVIHLNCRFEVVSSVIENISVTICPIDRLSTC